MQITKSFYFSSIGLLNNIFFNIDWENYTLKLNNLISFV